MEREERRNAIPDRLSLTFPTFLTFLTFPTFPTFLTFPTFPTFPTFLTFPRLLCDTHAQSGVSLLRPA
jgi:hypothetical protein